MCIFAGCTNCNFVAFIFLFNRRYVVALFDAISLYCAKGIEQGLQLIVQALFRS